MDEPNRLNSLQSNQENILQNNSPIPKGNKTKLIIIILSLATVSIALLLYLALYFYPNFIAKEVMPIEKTNKIVTKSPAPTKIRNSEKNIIITKENKLYVVPTKMNYTPVKDSVNYPFYDLRIYSVNNIYIENENGEKMYVGADINENLSINKNYEYLDGVEVYSMSSEDGFYQMSFDFRPAKSYKLIFKDDLRKQGSMIVISYGYGNHDETTFFQLLFGDFDKETSEFELLITPQGVTLDKDIKPTAFASSSDPIDMISPIITGKMKDSKIEVNVTDDSLIQSLKCAKINLNTNEDEPFDMETLFEYTEPVLIDKTIETLTCQAIDENGNFNYWTYGE